MKKRSKEKKSLEIFKKGFRKNEVVIYAIALMLVTAGYFNYTSNLDNNSVETYAGEIQNVAKETKKVEEKKDSENTENEVTLEEKKESDNKKEEKEVAEKQEEQENIVAEEKVAIENGEDNNQNSDEKNKNEKTESIAVASDTNSSENKEDNDDIGDAKLVNSNEVVKKEDKSNKNEEKTDNSSDYFANSKLERDTNYADMISTYTKIIEDGSVSETQKSIAMKEITKITNTKNAVSVCENILSTKGFENYVVLVNKDSINVVVKTKDGLTPNKVAQIQNVVSREFDSKIENIHITEK